MQVPGPEKVYENWGGGGRSKCLEKSMDFITISKHSTLSLLARFQQMRVALHMLFLKIVKFPQIGWKIKIGLENVWKGVEFEDPE